jgi:hypothetical protein
LLEAGEVARGEVLEDVVAAVLAQRRDEKRLHAFESEFVEVVVWNYLQRENTVDEGGRRREEEGRGAHNWGEVALLVPGCVGMWGCMSVCSTGSFSWRYTGERIACV